MTTNNAQTQGRVPANPPMGLDIQDAAPRTTSAEFGIPGVDPQVVSVGETSVAAEFGTDGKRVPKPDVSEAVGEEEGADYGGDVSPEDNVDTAEAAEEEAALELPEYDPDNEEVVSQYEAKYFTEVEGEGPTLNMEAFNEELASIRAKDPNDWNLKPDTRKFLTNRLGISDSLIDNHLAGLKAQHIAAEQQFFGNPIVGSKENYDAMLEWGKENYTPEQKAKFNAGAKAGGQDALDQIELLANRMSRAGVPLKGTEGDNAAKSPTIGIKRPASPKKDVTSKATGETTPAAKPFATEEEHRAALKGAKTEAELQNIRARLRASPWYANRVKTA